MAERIMRKGFTTGSCAAAAAKASCYMLLSGRERCSMSIKTPGGPAFDAKILNTERSEGCVSCAVRKDGGDDPDVTSGALIYAEVRYTEGSIEGSPQERTESETESLITIEGGTGVGRVTRPGLDQPVGEAAINSVPRSMIKREVADVMEMFDCREPVTVTISVPEGGRIAEHTFNPRLGIEGGISIIGTTGIVEPMSRQAILDTIAVELRQKKAEGHKVAFISPGNYGLDFMMETYGVDLDRSVKCSNFIGETVDLVVNTGFSGLMLTGHAGKLVKVAGGIMNTHSREADCRMEIIAAAALRAGAGREELLRILGCLTTEEAFNILHGSGRDIAAAADLMERIVYHLRRRSGRELEIGCIMYSRELGQLAATENAASMIENNKAIWNA